MREEQIYVYMKYENASIYMMKWEEKRGMVRGEAHYIAYVCVVWRGRVICREIVFSQRGGSSEAQQPVSP